MEKILPQTSGVDHKIYKRVENPKDADACAWVFKNAKEFVPYYFKFPAVAPHEIRVKIHYSGLCHSDVSTGRNMWEPCEYPVCVGHEVIGEAQIVGSEVKDFKVGDMVIVGPIRDACFNCEHCNKGQDNLCAVIDKEEKFLYGRYFGGWATHIQQPAHHIYHLPEGMDPKTSAPIICAGVTVLTPMQRHITERRAKVGIIGIGGLGHLAIQYGKAMGLEVTAFTTKADKVEECYAFGAHRVILVDEKLEDLRKLHDQFDFLINNLYVIDMKTTEAYLMLLKNGGSLIQIGLPPVKQPMQLMWHTLVLRQLSILGTLCGSVKDNVHTYEYSRRHGIKVDVEEFSFEEFPKALSRLELERPHYRCVVNVKDFVDRHFRI